MSNIMEHPFIFGVLGTGVLIATLAFLPILVAIGLAQ